MSRLFGFLLLVNCTLLPFQLGPPKPQPVSTASTLNLSEMLLQGPEGPSFANVTFLSNTSIAIRECSTADHIQTCPLSVFRWEKRELDRAAQVAQAELKSSRASADGSRRLLDFDEREVPGWQHALEIAHTLMTLGMSAPEDVNREVVQVVDTVTRRSCFEWRNEFPMTYGRPHSAAISPSGEFVAIVDQNKISIYQLPAVCRGARISRDKE